MLRAQSQQEIVIVDQCINEIGLGLQQSLLQFAQEPGRVSINRGGLCNFAIGLDAAGLKSGFLIVDDFTRDFHKIINVGQYVGEQFRR
jgi:hypothetical protein